MTMAMKVLLSTFFLCPPATNFITTNTVLKVGRTTAVTFSMRRDSYLGVYLMMCGVFRAGSKVKSD